MGHSQLICHVLGHYDVGGSCVEDGIMVGSCVEDEAVHLRGLVQTICENHNVIVMLGGRGYS